MKLWARVYDRYLGSDDVRRTERLVELVTISLALVLLFQLLLSGLRLAILSAPDEIPPGMDGVSDAQLLNVERVSAAQSEEIRARPVFWLSRRPVAGAVAGVAGESQAAADLGSLEKVQLVGLFGSGETAGIIAIVDKKQRRVLLGAQVEGWTLASIRRNDVEFTRGDRREKLVLLPQTTLVTPLHPADSGPVPVPAAGGSGP